MNEESTIAVLTRALGSYAASLRELQPSADLDARMASSIQEHTGVRRPRPVWRRPMPWLAAAASAAAIVVGVALLMVRAKPEQPVPEARFALPSNQYSLWPTEAAVFRVKANLNATAAPAADERQYWIDVRVANDGSMRIVRVIPANGNE